MKPKLWIAFLLVVAMGSGWWTDLPAGAQRPADGRLQLMQLDREFDAATAERGIEGWLAYFEQNGSMLPAAGPPHTGQEAIRKALGPAFATPGFSLRWQPARAEIVIPGVLGYTVGRYTRKTGSPEGKTLVQQGTYFTLWRKQKDGLWKIALDTGSPDGPPRPIQ